MTELRVTEVNILQVRHCDALQLGAFEHMSFSSTKCQNVLQSKRFRREHTTSETHEIFAFDKDVNAVCFYSFNSGNKELRQIQKYLNINC